VAFVASVVVLYAPFRLVARRSPSPDVDGDASGVDESEGDDDDEDGAEA
jgi:hypothetical protein